MRIVIGNDHRGVAVKHFVARLLQGAGHTYENLGTDTTEAVDYPDIAAKVAGAVVRGDFGMGILICDTGIGMSIAANKVNGIRAALCCDTFHAQRARQHNNCNVLCLGAVQREDEIQAILTTFLNTPFEGGRHQARVNKIMALEG